MDRQGNRGRLEAAARWYADLQAADVSAATWEAFRAWEQDPLNAAAFREIELALPTLERTSLAEPPAAARQKPHQAGLWLGALAAGLAMAGLAGLTLLDRMPAAVLQPEKQVFATATGERRQVTLADGSLVDLDTLSRIEVAYSAEERRISLVEGRALFEVRPGKAPFVVEASGAETRALGTEFAVYLKPGGAEITLLEGAVRVQSPAAGRADDVVLAPGEQVRIEGGVAGPVRKIDVEAAMAWRTGILRFTDATLADAVSELNRYSETRIVIEGSSLAGERLSGAFRAGDQEQFVSALVMFLPVEVTRAGKEIRIRPASD